MEMLNQLNKSSEIIKSNHTTQMLNYINYLKISKTIQILTINVKIKLLK